MTKQELFDKCVTALIAQGGTCKTDDGYTACRYRGSHGTKCAVGVLIPDELYDRSMEGVTAYTLLDNTFKPGKFDAVREYLGVNNRKFLSQLQRCHDFASSSEIMFRNLQELAIREKLDYTVLKQRNDVTTDI